MQSAGESVNSSAQPQHRFTRVLRYPMRHSKAAYLYILLPKTRLVRPKAASQIMDPDCKAFAIVCIAPFSRPYSSSSAFEHPATYNEMFDTGRLLLAAPASDAPHAPGITHNVSFSSGYGASQSVSEAPPIIASTSGEAQAIPRYEIELKARCDMLIGL